MLCLFRDFKGTVYPLFESDTFFLEAPFNQDLVMTPLKPLQNPACCCDLAR